jgi:hypothetical protein
MESIKDSFENSLAQVVQILQPRNCRNNLSERATAILGAAHLKNLDTSPRSKRAALLTFVSSRLVLLTRTSAALSGSSVTIVRTGSQT